VNRQTTLTVDTLHHSPVVLLFPRFNDLPRSCPLFNFGTHSACAEACGSPLTEEEEAEMNSNYMFLCGVMWCKFGQQEAGKELLRAAKSGDPDMSALAWAMLAKGARRLRDLA
jgi:hypothetical protein